MKKMKKPGQRSCGVLWCWVLWGLLSAGTNGLAASEQTQVASSPAKAQILNAFQQDPDFQQLVSSADIVLNRPVARRESGMPIGTGRVGSLVWTTPQAIKFQINHTDVYASDCTSRSFFQRDSDYGFGLGFVDVRLVDNGEDVFTSQHTKQRLSVYDAVLNLQGRDVAVRVFGWSGRDVLVVEVTDQRKQPQVVKIVLRTLRPCRVRRFEHLALSDFVQQGETVVLRQRFTEGDYYCGSALAVRVLGRPVKIRQPCDEQVELVLPAGKGRFTVLLAADASFDRGHKVVDKAIQKLNAAERLGADKLFEQNRRWWHSFWSRWFIRLHSEDGQADDVQLHYYYYLYVMACSSRGRYPPRFGGMIWKTGGDFCRWGTKHWWHNLSCYYRAVFESGHWELLEPVFNMYSNMYDSCARAAQQTWGCHGIWIPETVDFNGMAELPEEIAREMQDLYLLRKPWELRSLRFRQFAVGKHPHISRWNWKGPGHWENGQWTFKESPHAPFSYLVHILTTTAKVAYFYWLRYEYTLDETWLRERAYPMLKGTAELFRTFPGVWKEADGKYHIHNVNNHEPVRGCRDAMESIAAMKGVLPLAIYTSERLNVDKTLRAQWRELLENLTDLPTNDDPDSLTPRRPGDPVFWTAGRFPFRGGRTDWGRLIPVVYYDLCTLETPNERMRQIANASFDHAYPHVDQNVRVHVLSRCAIAAALLGRAQAVQYMIPNQIRQSKAQIKRFIDYRITRAGILDNRMTLREGAEAIGIQRLGRAAAATQYALLQSVPPAPGQPPVIHVFPAWPKQWEAEFRLAARGGFRVQAAQRNGHVAYVQIESTAGAVCRIRNPWPGCAVSVCCNGKVLLTSKRDVLSFPTTKGRVYQLTQAVSNQRSQEKAL